MFIPIPFIRNWWLPFPAATMLAAGLLAGCSATDKKQVCEGKPEHVVLVAATSISDLELSQQFTPTVAKQAITRAATSCGSLSVGLLGGKHAEADLVLQQHQFVPSRNSVYGSVTPIREPMEAAGKKFVSQQLLQPLAQATPIGGSPFLNGLTRIAAELKAHHVANATIVVVGDGLAVERGIDGRWISFTDNLPDERAVRAYAPLYAPLNDSCVILAGSGAASELSDQRLRAARQLLGGVLEEAGAKFVATRGDDIPWVC